MKTKLIWGLIYTGVFAGVFALSAFLKLQGWPGKDPMPVTWNDSVGTRVDNLSYGPEEANKFDLYLPADKGKETYGLVVYLHAGGFTGGDKSDDAKILEWICSQGYVAAGVNYTLLSDKNPTASVYSMSLEVQESIPAIKEECEKLGYNVDRMAIGGGSAGGCLALIYAYRDAAASPIPVKFVFEGVGPAGFHHKEWTMYGLDKSDEAAAELFTAMSGKKITPEMIKNNDYAAEVKDISPAEWVNAKSVPLLAAYGTYDKIEPYKEIYGLIKKLDEYNIPNKLILFPHSGHGLQNDSKQFLEYANSLKSWLKTYLS